MLLALFSTGGTSALSVLWVRVSPEEPMVIGGTGEMDRLHNPSTSPYFASYYCCMFMFTLHPRLYRPYAT